MAAPIGLSSPTGVTLGAIARAPAAWLTYAVASRLSSLPAAVAYWQTPPLARNDTMKDKLLTALYYAIGFIAIVLLAIAVRLG
jgi:hypothetical protein